MAGQTYTEPKDRGIYDRKSLRRTKHRVSKVFRKPQGTGGQVFDKLLIQVCFIPRNI